MSETLDTPLPNDRLWTMKHLAAYLGFAHSTVQKWASQEPHRLPPPVAACADPRWEPSVCREWSIKNSGARNPQPMAARSGRRRLAV
jgi:hypothetical protein